MLIAACEIRLSLFIKGGQLSEMPQQHPAPTHTNTKTIQMNTFMQDLFLYTQVKSPVSMCFSSRNVET